MKARGLFAPLDGFSFYIGQEPLVLRVGAYHGNGRVGIEVYSAAGEALDKLTVNLPDLPLAEDEVFVPMAPLGPDGDGGRMLIQEALLETGLFKAILVPIPSGFVEDYARRWALTRTDPLIRCRSHGVEYLVQDEATMAKLRQDFERRKQEIAAEVTVKALQRTV